MKVINVVLRTLFYCMFCFFNDYAIILLLIAQYTENMVWYSNKTKLCNKQALIYLNISCSQVKCKYEK